MSKQCIYTSTIFTFEWLLKISNSTIMASFDLPLFVQDQCIQAVLMERKECLLTD